MRYLSASLAGLLFIAASGAAQSADQGSYTITGTVATGLAAANAAVTITGADGQTLSQSATTGSDGTYSITFPTAPTFPVQVTSTVNGQTLSNLATGATATSRNLNQVTSAAASSAISNSGSLSNVTETGLNSAGQTILDTALGGGVSFSTFSSNSFKARTDATDYTQTASVADVFLDTLGERATSSGTALSGLLTTQTTPLLETDSFAVDLSSNLALVDTTDTVSSVITGGTKAQAVNSVATSIRSVVTSIGTKDKAAVAAARAVGAAIKTSISTTNSLTSSTELSNLANNVTLLTQPSVTSLVTSSSANSLSQADLITLAQTLGTNQGTALKRVDLASSRFTETRVNTDLTTLTTSLAGIGNAVQRVVDQVAGGTDVNTALNQNADDINNSVTRAVASLTQPSSIRSNNARSTIGSNASKAASAGGGGAACTDSGSPSGTACPD